MDLLLATDRWDETGGGRERYLGELRASLTRRGGSITVMTREAVGGRRLRQGIDRFRRSHPASLVLAASPVSGATHYQLHSGVHAAAYAAESEAYESALRRLCFGPALRLNIRRSRLLRAEERVLDAPSGTKLMTFSAHSREELQRLFGVSRNRIAVARPGVDLDVFRPAVRGDGSAVITAGTGPPAVRRPQLRSEGFAVGARSPGTGAATGD